MASDRRLRAWYRTYNTRYFSGQLPLDTLVVWDDCGPQALGLCDKDQSTGRFTVMIDSTLRYLKMTTVARSTLLHEMVHVLLGVTHPRHQHGKVFQKEMLRLANEGAFRKLW